MSRYVSTPEREAATPVGARLARIRQLEQLAARVVAELDVERAALQRILECRPEAGEADLVARTGASPARIREWARSVGMDVNPRGRVPYAVTAAFIAANPAEVD